MLPSKIAHAYAASYSNPIGQLRHFHIRAGIAHWPLVRRIQCSSNLIGVLLCNKRDVNRFYIRPAQRRQQSVQALAMGDNPAVSPSLLRPLENLPQCDDSAFGLGVSELLGEPPSTKRLKLSLRKAPHDRFWKPVTAEERSESTKGVVPTNMKSATNWALRSFGQWRENRNKSVPEDPVPENLFEKDAAEVLCKWLCCFVQETRKESGKTTRQVPYGRYCRLFNAY